MKTHLHNLFIPHHGNNHKSKILHNHSLFKLVLIVMFFQLMITGITQTKPGVLGFASNISVNDIITLSNQRRQAEGLPALEYNESLSNSANQKAQHMFANNYWAHNAPDGTSPWYFFNKVGYSYLYAGENLARDFGDSSAVVQAWMDSPTHRDNIMSGRYTQIGVAVVNGTLNGQETTLVVQHFGHPAASQPRVPVEAVQQPAPQVQIQGEQIKDLPVQTEPIIEAEPIEDLVNKPTDTIVYDPENFPAELVEENQNWISQSQSWLSAFDLTKSVNLALITIIIIALGFDAFLIWHRKTQRRSGKSFIHLAFLILIGMIIILTKSGNIL